MKNIGRSCQINFIFWLQILYKNLPQWDERHAFPWETSVVQRSWVPTEIPRPITLDLAYNFCGFQPHANTWKKPASERSMGFSLMLWFCPSNLSLGSISVKFFGKGCKAQSEMKQKLSIQGHIYFPCQDMWHVFTDLNIFHMKENLISLSYCSLLQCLVTSSMVFNITKN